MPNFQNYSSLRKTSPILRYGMQRRTEAIATLMSEIPQDGMSLVIDVGTADGAMIANLSERFSATTFIGIEPKLSLCQIAHQQGLTVLAGSARCMPFSEQCCDVILLSATLKHLSDYQEILTECRDVIAPKGHLVVSDPTPAALRLGVAMGHFDRRYLHNIWSLPESCRRVESQGFRIIKAFRYMVSPIGFPGVRLLERVLQKVHLTQGFLHQALLAQKTSG